MTANKETQRCLSTLNQQWWYRLLKVIWLFLLSVTMMFMLLIASTECDGSAEPVSDCVLLGAILLPATYAVFELVRRAFYFVYFGTIAPKTGEELELKKSGNVYSGEVRSDRGRFEIVRRAFYRVYFGTIAPKQGEGAEQKRALQKALRTAQKMAARRTFFDIKIMSPAGLGLFFIVLFTLSVVVTIIQVISDRLTEKEGIRELAQTARELISAQKALIDNDDTKATDERRGASNTPEPLAWKPGLEPQQKASGRVEDPKEFFQRLNETVKELGEKALIDQKQMVAEFDQIGLETMLLPETLTKKSGIEDNRRKLKRWSGWAERNMMLSRAVVKEWEERIGSVASGYKHEAEFLDGMDKRIRNRKHLERQMYACHKAIIAAITKMNEFMAARLGKVVVQDGQLRVNTQDEINTYNEYVEENNKQAQLLADLQQRYLQELQQGLKNISELAR